MTQEQRERGEKSWPEEVIVAHRPSPGECKLAMAMKPGPSMPKRGQSDRTAPDTALPPSDARPRQHRRGRMRRRELSHSIGVDAAVAGTKALLFRLFQFVGLETNPPALIDDLIDLAGALRALQIVNDHVPLVAEISLTTFRMR